MTTATPQTELRIERLARELVIDGVDVFLANSAVTLGYLHGLHESGAERFLALAISQTGKIRLICPGLTVSQATRAGITDIRSWRDGEDPIALLHELVDDWNLRSSVIAVDDDMPSALLLAMQDALPAALFRPGQRIVSRLMRSKDEEELDLLYRAGAIADQALPKALEALKPGVTELELERVLYSEMQRLGGIPTFAIVAAGANGAEPHHASDDTVIQEGDVVVMDFGCQVGGYQSDITRSACCGKASDEAKTVYRTVYAAHMAGRQKIAPAVPAQEVDRAARKVITDAGFGEFFIHRTGHGLGMRIHEEPYIVEGNAEPLAAGNCFSIEPGIYLPGRLGVRIENIVTVTDDGHASFNVDPPAEILEVS